MEFHEKGFRWIHEDGIEKADRTPEYMTTLIMIPEVYLPIRNMLPISFEWRINIEKSGRDICRVCGIDEYLLQFEKELPYSISRMTGFVEHTEIKLAKGWAIITADTQLSGCKLPRLPENEKSEVAWLIIQTARELKLLI